LVEGFLSIFAGFLAGKIPQMIEMIKTITPQLKAIFDGIAKTVGFVYQFFQSVSVIVYELAKSLFTLTPPDMEKISSEFTDITTSFSAYFESALNVLKVLTFQDFKDPKDLDKTVSDAFGIVDKEVKNNTVDESELTEEKKKEAPKVDYSKKQVSQEELEAKMKDPKVIELANQLGDGKPKTKATNGYLNAVSVGKMLTDQGVGVWQHPDFNIKTGFTGSGLEGMMKRASNSFHSSGEALDIPIAGQGEERLNQIASMLGANKKKLGINELKWKDDADHMDHIHVSFKGTEPIKPASVSAAPSSKSKVVDNITAAKDIDSPMSDMQGQINRAVLSQQVPTIPTAPAPSSPPIVVGGSSGLPTPDIDTLLNTMQRTRVLTALAYQ
jgi:hypothetical protein